MNKKTIIYVGGFELPDKNAAAQRVLSVAKIFKDLGFNIVFLGINKEIDRKKYNIEDSKKSYFGFDSWAIPYPKNKLDWFNHLKNTKEIEYLVNTYYKNDLYGIICYNHPFLSQYKIKKICERNNSYYIPDATEWYSAKGKGILFGVIKWIDTILRMRYIHTKSDGIIATSKFLVDFYKKRNCNVLDLPSMFDSEQFLNIKPINIQKKDSYLYFMYAGSAFDENNPKNAKKNIKDRLDKVIVLMYEMFKLNKKFILNIFGLEKSNYLKAFPEQTNILNEMSENIFFNGKISHSKVLSYIKFSDFTIFLRAIDRVTLAGFPTKFSESLICGTPIITNKISNIEKYLYEFNNGFFLDYDNQENQVSKLKDIFSLSDDERIKMKLYCENNKYLDYRNFIEPTNIFLDRLKRDYV